MGNTKEAILCTALELFARDGYEAVSVSQIAGALGMTKGALYKHYASKRDIFDQILVRMEQQDAAQAAQFQLPEGPREAMEAQYRAASLEQLLAFSLAQFRYWTQDGFSAAFRRMLTLEQFRSAEMQRLYQQYLTAGPAGYVADLLDALGIPEPREQALSYYGAMFLAYSAYDGAADKEAVEAWLRRTLERLCRPVLETNIRREKT